MLRSPRLKSRPRLRMVPGPLGLGPEPHATERKTTTWTTFDGDDREYTMDQTDFYLVGHRATGKTTTGRLIAEQLDWSFVDLDARIADGEGEPCSELVSRDESGFRQLERRYLGKVRGADADGPRIIALGGGYRPIPTDGIVVWLERDGWRETAVAERSSIDASVDVEAELDRMEREREPRWTRRSHLRYRTPRGRGPERAAADVAKLLRWLLEGREDPLFSKTYLIPEPDRVERAFRDKQLLGCGGVELRSDLHDAGAFERPGANGEELLASLRTDDPDWLSAVVDDGARAVDLDVDYLETGIRALNHTSTSPATVLVSTHPETVRFEDLDRLEASVETARERLEVAAPKYICKYAPRCESWGDVRRAFEAAERLRNAGHPVTFLPQGDRFAGIRPRLARDNATNYLSVGLGGERPAPLDLGDWIPHLGCARPDHTEALIGGPVVRHSQGARWHRAASEREGEPVDYLKVQLGRDRAEDELEDLLVVLQALDVRGGSVTSPLKKKIVTSEEVVPDGELEAANTLVRRTDAEPRETENGPSSEWRAHDTDAFGMTRTLEALEARGVEPGPVAVIGRGGVSPAVRRGIDESDWTLSLHASGREGWPPETDSPDELALVVNAAGPSDTVYRDAPESTAWLDLHYRDVRAAPEDVDVHLNGDTFFDAQAERQRRLWRDGDRPSSD